MRGGMALICIASKYFLRTCRRFPVIFKAGTCVAYHGAFGPFHHVMVFICGVQQ